MISILYIYTYNIYILLVVMSGLYTKNGLWNDKMLSKRIGFVEAFSPSGQCHGLSFAASLVAYLLILELKKLQIQLQVWHSKCFLRSACALALRFSGAKHVRDCQHVAGLAAGCRDNLVIPAMSCILTCHMPWIFAFRCQVLTWKASSVSGLGPKHPVSTPERALPPQGKAKAKATTPAPQTPQPQAAPAPAPVEEPIVTPKEEVVGETLKTMHLGFEDMKSFFEMKDSEWFQILWFFASWNHSQSVVA